MKNYIPLSTNLRRWRKKDWVHWDDGEKIYCEESGKIGYKTEEEADMARLEAEKKDGRPLRIYDNCEYCDGWHLTSRVY